MKILSTENNLSYNVNNTCQIYIIKQYYFGEEDDAFNKIYADLLKDSSFIDKLSRVNSSQNQDIKLKKLIRFDEAEGYTPISLNNKAFDFPKYISPDLKQLYFLTDLLQLRNCPLLDVGKTAYVFQVTNKNNIWKGSVNQSGIGDITSFNVNFSVNGQSSCEIQLNNQDFKYNFKYFDDPDKYNLHLKPYFDTNDIIIVRMQKKNLTPSVNKYGVPSSFKQASINDYKDLYSVDKDDPMTTIFTGYINNINESFSYETGTQTMSITCTGPSKKLAWTRTVVKQAAWTKDSASAIVPISAFIHPQTLDNKNKTPKLQNRDIISNLIVRTYSGLTLNPEMLELLREYNTLFDTNINNKNSVARKEYEKKLENANEEQKKKIREEMQQLETKQIKKQFSIAEKYNALIDKHFDNFKIVDKNTGIVSIIKNSFIVGDWKPQPIFVINGTNQPAYQYAFNDFSMFQSDWNTVYQFIKSIADNLLFNFYDDPYGTIHFGVPDITLHHLHRNVEDSQNQISLDPNVLDQINSFSQTQDTESIANIQPMEAKPIYGLEMNFINACAKDYKSIAKYGEKMMQPLSVVGITSMTALRYISKMRMTKYNRKALANIRIQCQGTPDLKMDKYAYIKPLRKLFYIESYSHSYQAGGNFTTSINGTYLRDILAKANVINNAAPLLDNKHSGIANIIEADTIIKNSVDSANNKKQLQQNIFDKQLRNCNSFNEIQKMLSEIKYPDSIRNYIYQCYVNQFAYPEDCVDLQKEIEQLYTDNVISDCYLDGYFWALPFDADPYKIALEIQEEERSKNNIKSKDNKIKVISQNNTKQLSAKPATAQTKSLTKDKIKSILSPNVPKTSTKILVKNEAYNKKYNNEHLIPTLFSIKSYKTMELSLDTSSINVMQRLKNNIESNVDVNTPVLKRGKE